MSAAGDIVTFAARLYGQRAATACAGYIGRDPMALQPLARLEATITVQMLAERMPGPALAAPGRRRDTTTIRGPLRLPVAAHLPVTAHLPARAGRTARARLSGAGQRPTA